MTVPASRRGKSRMEVFAKANELCSYTVEITANERTFKPEFAMLTARIVDASVAIGQYLWSANNIKVVDDDDLAERRGLQRKAKVKCNELIFLIGVAKKTFHLRGRRVHHWSGLVSSVRSMTSAWSESDVRRFRAGH